MCLPSVLVFKPKISRSIQFHFLKIGFTKGQIRCLVNGVNFSKTLYDFLKDVLLGLRGLLDLADGD